MSEMVSISFEASIALPIEELDACLGDAAQCVQNAIGRTGALVVSAQADHFDDDDGLAEEEHGYAIIDSLDELTDRELADADRRWPDDDEHHDRLMWGGKL